MQSDADIQESAFRRGTNTESPHPEFSSVAYTGGSVVAARTLIWSALMLLFTVGLVAMLFFQEWFASREWFSGFTDRLPRDPMSAALRVMDVAPIIDGHIDLPIVVRHQFANNISAVDLESLMPGHVDIPRLRQGKVGGMFWSIYVECSHPEYDKDDFLRATWTIRDALEQIDVTLLLINKYSDTFQLALNAEDIRSAIRSGKIASLLGLEGGHMLGNSIALLRRYHALGVRYLTLTHTCHNVFADSCGYAVPNDPLHGGLSPLGRSLISEMNRLGVLVDLSHTSDETAAQALRYSRAPVIWSHSSARAVRNVTRNVPDDILELLGTGVDQNDGIVMVTFVPFFTSIQGNASVVTVADHIEHIARIAGKKHVGIGSDFDGVDATPEGLEDASKYPSLIAELRRRGWSKFQLSGLLGANLLRVLAGAERVAQELQAARMPPVTDLYDKRPDLPVGHPKWLSHQDGI